MIIDWTTKSLHDVRLDVCHVPTPDWSAYHTFDSTATNQSNKIWNKVLDNADRFFDCSFICKVRLVG
jgi:hypothetical protein